MRALSSQATFRSTPPLAVHRTRYRSARSRTAVSSPHGRTTAMPSSVDSGSTRRAIRSAANSWKDNAHQPGDSHDTALLKDGRFAYALGDSTAGDHDVFTSIWDSRSHTNDFNGDGHSDILLQNINTGAPYVWFTDGTSLIGNGPMVNELGPGWHGITGGDFNGDNRSDVLW